MDAKQLRQRLAAARRSKRSTPVALQKAAVEYGIERKQQGQRWKGIADELGVSAHTLAYWKAVHGGGVAADKLAPVEVVVESQPVEPLRVGGFVVHTRGGVVIEGMDVAELAELVQRLR